MFSFLKKSLLGLYKNLFWYISRKIGKIFKRSHLKHYLSNKKYFQKVWWKWIGFLKKIFLLKNQIVTISGVFCHILYIFQGQLITTLHWQLVYRSCLGRRSRIAFLFTNTIFRCDNRKENYPDWGTLHSYFYQNDLTIKWK